MKARDPLQIGFGRPEGTKRGPARPTPQASYDQLEASLLHCPKCRVAVQVRKRLLLVLPTGDKYEYVCVHCGTTCGDKMEIAPHGLGR